MSIHLYTGSRLLEYENFYDLCLANFKMDVLNNGIIEVDFNRAGYNKHRSTMSYCMEQYTKEEAIRDYIKCYMAKQIPRYGYKVV